MTLRLTIQFEVSADPADVAAVLERMASNLRDEGFPNDAQYIRDGDGNAVGTWSIA